MIPYTIKTFRGGKSDESDKGIAGSFKYGHGLDIHGEDDVIRCGSTMATINETTVVDLIHHFVTAADGSTYAFGNGGKVYSIAGHNADPVVSLKYTDSNGAILGAAEWELNDGNNYLFWATATSIARKLLPGDDAWGDVTQNWKVTLDSATYHTMKNIAGALMIANREFLASVDYYGNFDPAALNIRPGNLIKCLEERDDYAILGSYRLDNAEEGHIWSWVTTASNWIQKKRIPVKGVNALITAELMLLQGGAEGEIFFSDFIESVPLNSISGLGQVNPGGVAIENDLATFGFYGGSYPGIWQFGRRRKNRPFSLNYAYRLAPTVGGSTVAEIGATKVSNGILFASWKTTETDSSKYGIDCVSSTTKATGVYEGLEFDGGIPYQEKLYQHVKLTMAPLASGTSVSVKFKLNKESGWRYASLGDGGTTFSTAGATKAIFNITKPGEVYEVGVELNPSGSSTPEVLSINTYIGEEGYEF